LLTALIAGTFDGLSLLLLLLVPVIDLINAAWRTIEPSSSSIALPSGKRAYKATSV
jgi:hypothetical protein